MSVWKYRPPPEGEATFCMCSKASQCSYGDFCINAHSMMELDEWNRRRRNQQYFAAQQDNEVGTFVTQLLKNLIKAKAENIPENRLVLYAFDSLFS